MSKRLLFLYDGPNTEGPAKSCAALAQGLGFRMMGGARRVYWNVNWGMYDLVIILYDKTSSFIQSDWMNVFGDNRKDYKAKTGKGATLFLSIDCQPFEVWKKAHPHMNRYQWQDEITERIENNLQALG